MTSNQEPFFPDIDPRRRPSKPERPLYDDSFEEDYSCPTCAILISDHSTKQIVECALAEVRGGAAN
jgi:hypothetical protein